MGLQNTKIKLCKKIYEYLEEYITNKDEKYIRDKAFKIVATEAKNGFQNKAWSRINKITFINTNIK